MAIEIVDFPINSMVIFHCYVSSPEGIPLNQWWTNGEIKKNTLMVNENWGFSGF